jgi:hypothetical protein
VFAGGILIGLVGGLEGVPGDVTGVTSPRAVLARDRQVALLLMLVGGLAVGPRVRARGRVQVRARGRARGWASGRDPGRARGEHELHSVAVIHARQSVASVR